MSRSNEHRDDDVAEDRQEVEDQASSAKHTPHVSENESDEQVQDEMPSPTAAPVLPANASGSDKVGTDDQAAPIDDESMYDQRPERDKDRHVGR